MRFYTGTQFPPRYRNGAFVAMHGSWNRSKKSGYQVVALHFSPEPFLELLEGGAQAPPRARRVLQGQGGQRPARGRATPTRSGRVRR